MKTKIKQFSLFLTTFGLFALSLYLAFKQGSIQTLEIHAPLEGAINPIAASALVYTGLKATIAKVFIVVFNALMQLSGNSIFMAIILLALVVELVLLYPSVNIQLKQKKIHLFHRKLVNRFNKGQLSVSKTEDELHTLYDVNQRIHNRGAVLVVIQIALILFTFWGLNLMVNAPNLLSGSWSVLNFSLLSRPHSFSLPFVAALIYLLHALIKMHYKDKEDYISPSQTTLAFLFAIIGSLAVYFFAGIFAVALTVYFVTLVTFATMRYIYVEQHAKSWGKYVQRQLIKMLKSAKPHKSRFEYFSKLWNHLPVVRHINFSLLEEALSMTIGLFIALSFFGAFM